MAKTTNPFLKKPTGTAKVPVRVEKKHGLGGAGIEALISANTARAAVAVRAPVPPPPAPAPGAPLELVIADIDRSPYQPRRDFKDDELRELAESLKNNGLVQPPTVRKNAKGRWELIAGERRMRAAQLAGWKKIQVTVKNVDDLTAAAMTTTENLQREDLNPIEEANSYKTLLDRFNLTQDEVAERVGKARATVANAVRLLTLPDDVQMMVQARQLSAGHAKALAAVEDEKDLIHLAREAVEKQLTVRALETKVSRLNAPVPEKQGGVPDIPDAYVRTLTDKLKKYVGTAVRLRSGVTYPGSRHRHVNGTLEIDFFDNDELDRILAMIGVKVD